MATMMASGCSPEGAPGSTFPEGEWHLPCQPFGKEDRHGITVALTIRDGRMTGVSQMYERADCLAPSVRVEYTGSYIATARSETDWLFNHQAETITMTVDLQRVADWYIDPDNEDGCGYAEWRVGEPVSVLGRFCRPFQFPIARQTIYDRAFLSPGELRLGGFPLSFTALIAEQRPERANGLIFRRSE